MSAAEPAGATEPPGATYVQSTPQRLFFRLYRAVVSPLLHSTGVSSCRFQPTCSDYAEVAITRFGPVRGSWLALRRVARCHPFSHGGLDQVPER